MNQLPAVRAALVSALGLALLGACTSNSDAGGSGDDAAVTVSSTDDSCNVSDNSAPSGQLVFKVTNDGDQVTEFYLFAEDGKRIVGEVENIGPGLTRELVVTAEPGDYVTACKPGMTGEGIRADFTVTDSGKSNDAASSVDAQVESATEGYQAYVEEESEELLDGTRRFVAAYAAGHDARARALYPVVRVHWERIEPVAESFGDLDPKMDLREADLQAGQEWTGWHRIEKDLWPPKSVAYTALTVQARKAYADQLLADTQTLHERAETLELSVDQVANGAKSLLDEVATGKVTGEEEVWSHTDLYDFQANVEGARVAFEGLEPVLAEKDPALRRQIGQEFASLQTLLDRYRVGAHGFVDYETLSTAEVKQLSDSVNALAEPLSRLTSAVTL